VCGSAWENKRIELVPDVHKFPGHIACSSKTNSEIVIPIIKNSKVVAVLDIDSVEFDYFDEIDSKGLSQICDNLAKLF
jgi:GAF domain-containing protein